MFELKTFIYAAVSLSAGLLGYFYCTDPALKRTIGRNFLVLLLVTQGAAFLSPSLLVYNTLVGVAMFVGCKDRRMIAPTYLFLLVTLPLPNKAIMAGSTYLLGYDASISLGIAAVILIKTKMRGGIRRSPHWDALAFILFLLSVLPGARDSTFTNILRMTLDACTGVLLPYYVVSRSMRSFDDLRDGVYGFVAGITCLSVMAVYEVFHTWPLYRLIVDRYGLGDGHMMVKMRGGLLRAFGPYPESTSFALCLAVGFLAAYACRRLYRNQTRHYMVLAVILAGILSPQSRGAWLGLAAGVAAIDLFDRQIGALVKKAVLGAVAFVLLLGLSTALPAVRIVPGMTDEGGDTVDYRSDLLTRGLEEIRKHPLTGDTPTNIRIAMKDMTQGEGIIDFVNTFLYMGLIAGVPGFLAFVYMLLAPVVALVMASTSFARRHFAAFRRNSSASVVVGCLVGMAVMLAVTAMVNRTTTLTMVFLGMASVILNNMRTARRAMRRPQGGVPVEAQQRPAPPAMPPGGRPLPA